MKRILFSLTVMCGLAVTNTLTAQQTPSSPAPTGGAAANPTARGGERPQPLAPPPAVMPPPAPPVVSIAAPSPDPRVGLAPGLWNAGQASWNMKMISATPPSADSSGAIHTDLAFSGNYVIQGNYNGFEIWDISDPAKPILANAYTCPASQNDVSIHRNLLFMSSEATNSRKDCKFGGIPEPVSDNRVRGIRIFDIRDVAHPKLVASVETCRGSHTHTIVTPPGDAANIYIYVSGTANVRPAAEMTSCKNGGIDDPESARFRLEVIKVPLAKPESAFIVSSPRIFNNLPAPPRNDERAAIENPGRGGNTNRGGVPAQAAPAAPTGPNQCHDITVYPQVGLAGGACAGLGLLLDIQDAAQPNRIDMAADANMSYWHSATFNNDGTKVLFTDEWGGGAQPRCRATDKPQWGADALFTIENRNLVFHGYYKLPAAQSNEENCVAHNGSLIPIPGRDVMVQSFYQGGITVFEWTDIEHPREIAFFDRGPIDASRRVLGGSWSAYWYNGLIVSSEIVRGLDIFELLPSGLISQNEIDAAKTVRMDSYNPQDQQQFRWPPSFALAKAYVDQLERSNGMATAKIQATRDALAAAERANGADRRNRLSQLAIQLNDEATGSSDAAKVKLLIGAVGDLGKAP